jgi:hypothetical protein
MIQGTKSKMFSHSFIASVFLSNFVVKDVRSHSSFQGLINFF